MKVKIGFVKTEYDMAFENVTVDSDETPIMLILSDQEKDLITNMGDQTCFCCYPADMTISAAEDFMDAQRRYSKADDSFQHDAAHNVDEPFCEMSPFDLACIAYQKDIAPRAPKRYMKPQIFGCVKCETEAVTSTTCGICDECLQKLHLEGVI